jgi:polysaccharide biosynthesis/export protein
MADLIYIKMKLRRNAITAALAALLLCGGCKSSEEVMTGDEPPHASTPAPVTRSAPITASTAVTLSPGDVIKLSFSGAGELNQTQKIKADGKVNLPLIGEVAAAGKTVVDFQAELVGLYKPQLRNSDVLVTLESGIANVVISGFVGKPGKFSFDRPTTVFQAIMEAGGVTDYGNLSNVHLIRVVNGEQHTQVLNLRSAMKGKSTKVDYVKDGDVIYVARSLF